jgi:hypothetical protein
MPITFRLFFGKPEGKRQFGKLDIDGKTILKLIFKIEFVCGLDSTSS